MKAIDFTKPGGFPLTQNQLGYLQQAYTEAAKALAAIGGDSSVPFIVSGIDISNPSTGAYTATAGWLCYNGDLIKFLPGSITGASGASAPFVVISPSVLPLTFNDGSTPNVVLDNSATILSLPVATPTDATHFPLGALRRLGVGFGVRNREATWNTLTVSTAAIDGGVSGTIYYKKDFTANTLHIRGLLTANNAQNFAASPGTLFYVMGTLPSGYMPNNTVYFDANYFVASSIQDDAGVAWIKQVNCVINNFGQFLSNWTKPLLPTAGYGINFNTIIPLD
jgi:hypothetical protein